MGDSIRLTPQRTWRRLLGEALDGIGCALPEGGRILVAEVPPLDRATAEVLATRPRAVPVPFPAESVIRIRDPDSARASHVYASWARAA